jgi:hypothetical protein
VQSRVHRVNADATTRPAAKLVDANVGIDAFVVGDVDDDGAPDALVSLTAGDAELGLFRNLDSVDPVLEPMPGLVSFGDFNAPLLTSADVDRDGDLDVIWSQLDIPETVLLENDGDGGFSIGRRFANAAGSIGVADLDGVGELEVFMVNLAGPAAELMLLTGTAAGDFTVPDQAAGAEFVATDFDGDGDVDLLADFQSSGIFWRNDGAGNLTRSVVPGSGGKRAAAHDSPALLIETETDVVIAELGGDGTTQSRRVLGSSFKACVTCDLVVADRSGDGSLDATMIALAPNADGEPRVVVRVLDENGAHQSAAPSVRPPLSLDLSGGVWLLEPQQRCSSE